MADYPQREGPQVAAALAPPIAVQGAGPQFSGHDRLERPASQPQAQKWHPRDGVERRPLQSRTPALENLYHTTRSQLA